MVGFKTQTLLRKQMRYRTKNMEYQLDMCLWNTYVPGGNKIKMWLKSVSPTFWPHPTPRGRWCQWSVRESIDKLTVQIWWLYHHQNFKYCTLQVGNRQTDNLITRCPQQTFQAGGIKIPPSHCHTNIHMHLPIVRRCHDIIINVCGKVARVKNNCKGRKQDANLNTFGPGAFALWHIAYHSICWRRKNSCQAKK